MNQPQTPKPMPHNPTFISSEDKYNNLPAMPNGFVSWIETYHEAATNFAMILTTPSLPGKWLRELRDRDGLMQLPHVCLDFTNQFEAAFPEKDEDGSGFWDSYNWIDTVEACASAYAETGVFTRIAKEF